MKSSDNCKKIVREFEGLHDGNKRTPAVEPMLDCVGIPTIGWGCTSYQDGTKVTLKDKALTLDECEKLLEFHLQKTEAFINANVKVPITQNQFDALCSFAYNIGLQAFKTSTLLKKLNQGDYMAAAREFPRWNQAQGKVLKGLITRRSKEQRLFLSE